jgi:hypothetical protein
VQGNPPAPRPCGGAAQSTVIDTAWTFSQGAGVWWNPVKLKQASGMVNMGGDVPTWSVFRIDGPARNIRVVLTSSLGTQIDFTLNATVSPGHYLAVDPRP